MPITKNHFSLPCSEPSASPGRQRSRGGAHGGAPLGKENIMEKDTSITSETTHSEVTRPKLSANKERLRQLKVRRGPKAGLRTANSVYCPTHPSHATC